MSVSNLKRLQRIQSSLARLTVLPPLPVSGTELLSDLHWLPVASRITYKTCSLIHSVLNHKQPPYLASLVTPYQPPRSLRSSDAALLTVPRTRLIRSRITIILEFIALMSAKYLMSYVIHQSLKTEIYHAALSVSDPARA